MPIENQDILFASLLGGLRSVGTVRRSNIVQNELAKRVLPPIPFLPLKNENNVQEVFNIPVVDNNWRQQESIPEGQQFFPLSFSFTEGGVKWTFPYEPMINVSSGNKIVKRSVAKKGNKLIGDVKERWSRKDFEITVNGALIGALLKGTVEDCYPKAQLGELFQFLIFAKEIFVYSPLLEQFGITKVVVEDYSFPFTKGENVQAYELKLISDFTYNLLIKEDF